MQASRQRVVLVAAPPLLVATTFVAFQLLTKVFGLSAGYFLGFVFYWVCWCAGVPAIVLGREGIAAINGPLEELLWRGAYVAVFGRSRWLGYVYPNICFALWHLAPLSVIPNRAPGGRASFVLVSGVVGFLWGWVTRQTRSIRITSLAHALFDFSGLGGRLYF